MYQIILRSVTVDSLSQNTAGHHWYPFLKYQEECKAAGKEATVNDWMRATGQLQDRVDFEKAKEAAAIAASKAEKDNKETTKKSD